MKEISAMLATTEASLKTVVGKTYSLLKFSSAYKKSSHGTMIKIFFLMKR